MKYEFHLCEKNADKFFKKSLDPFYGPNVVVGYVSIVSVDEKEYKLFKCRRSDKLSFNGRYFEIDIDNVCNIINPNTSCIILLDPEDNSTTCTRIWRVIEFDKKPNEGPLPLLFSFNERKDTMKVNIPEIKEVRFNYPATIVYWTDGTKTVVICKENSFDKEKAVAMCFIKKLYKEKYHSHWYDKINDAIEKAPFKTDSWDRMHKKYIQKKKEAEAEAKAKALSEIKEVAETKTVPVKTPKEQLNESDAEDQYDGVVVLNDVSYIKPSSSPTNTPKINYDRIKSLYKAGYTADDIAKAMNTNVPTVCRSLHKIFTDEELGEIRRNPKKETWNPVPESKNKIDKNQVKECYDAGMTLKETSEYLGFLQVSIAKVASTLGLDFKKNNK